VVRQLTLGEKERTVDAISELSMALGYPPTVRELAERLDLSISATYERLVRLRADGSISWDSKKFRTLVVA
jgi:SOS-response transcriptional repressor LexA